MRTRILVVESSKLLTDLLKQYETTQEWQIYRAYTLKEIRQCFGRTVIDVILLNLIELKQNGIVILKKVRKLNVPVLLINSGNQLSLSIEGMKMGAFDDILMPFNIDTLIEKIIEASKAKIKVKSKFPLMERFQNVLIAATFAEAGEAEIAKTYLTDNKVK
jgi:DNA-binding response OmpR family regulator